MEVHLGVRLLRCDYATAYNEALAREADNLIVRIARGRKMRTDERLFDEFAAAWQFPPYFGENWDAFDECVRDLYQWLPRQRGFVVVVFDAAEVLIDSDRPEALSLLVDMLGQAAVGFSEPIENGNWWDRTAMEFHVELQALPADAETAERRWRAAGATVAIVDPPEPVPTAEGC